MLQKWVLYVGAVFILSIAYTSATDASEVSVFGPQQISPPLTGALVSKDSFSLASETTGVLTIQNGDGSDLTPLICTGVLAAKIKCAFFNAQKTLQAIFERPRSLEIKLNDQVILAKAQYSPRIGSYSVAVNLLKQNTLSVATRGLPTSGATLEIKAEVFQPPNNQLPLAQLSLTPTQGFAPLVVSASSFGSLDPDGSIQAYAWDFGDGFLASGMLASHVYTVAGTYTVTLTVTDNLGATASQAQSVVVIQNQAPTVDLKITSASSGIAPFIASFDGSGSTEPENQSMKYDWDFGDGETALNAAAQVTHQYTSAGVFTVTLTVTDALGSSSQAQGQITVTQPVLPPEPSDLALPLSRHEQTSFYDSVGFLLSGTNPVQKNVDLTKLDESRVSVLRGKIFDDNGEPLGAVKVRVLNHPEFGETLSRLDGQFDLIVNGGGYLTLLYDLSGYLSSSRQVEVSYKDYFFAPNVVLTKLDDVVTRVSLGASTTQAARSSVSSDFSGERTPTVVIPSGTTASLVLPDGSVQAVSSLSLRLTEYTKGDNGPQKMPADLPAGVAYTHAVELSADEAIAQNAKHIQFSKPVSYYVDNFLNIPIGYGVPLGSLNPDTKLWEAEHDGVVLKILDIQNNSAVLDVKGQGQAATSADLLALNITQEELAQIASLYSSGKSLWRVQVSHFSAIDTNFMTSDFFTSLPSLGDAYSYPKPKVGECTDCGSVIDVNQLSLKERIQTAVLPFDLWYSSDNAAPKVDQMELRVPLSGTAIENDLIEIEYEVEIAGKKITGTAPPQPNQVFSYTWDGKDAYGRDYPYEMTAKAVVRHKFKRYYAVPRTPNETTWGVLGPNVIITFNEERDGTYIEKFSSVKLGTRRSDNSYGINGWTPSIVHSFNPITKTLYFGHGDFRDIDETLRTLITIAGNGLTSGAVDGMPALNNPIGVPVSVAPAIDGSIYFADAQSAKLIKIDTAGMVSTVAGKIKGQSSGDGGLALDASFSTISKISVGPDGSIYVVESDLNIVRKITPDGMINKIAGAGGSSNIVQDNVPATQIVFGKVSGVVPSKDGSVFISDRANNVVYRLGTDGIIRRFAGVGVAGYAGDDGPASQALLSFPVVCDIGPNEEVYILDNNVIRMIDPAGFIHAAVGKPSSSGNMSVDGSLALQAELRQPSDVKVAKNGNIYFIESEIALKRVNSQGLIETLSNNGTHPLLEPGLSTIFSFFSNSMFLSQDGSAVIADTGNNRLRRLGQVFIGNDPELFQMPSEDGSEIYQFSARGRHLSTLFAKTGKTKWQFSYVSAGLLSQLTDADGRTLQVQRDSQGRVTSLTNKYGQNITTGFDAEGWLTSVQLPSGDTYQLEYSKAGLLSVFTKPHGNSSRFVFDNKNNLVEDQDALGGVKTLTRSEVVSGFASTITYPDNTKRIATSQVFASAHTISEITERDGTKTSWMQDLNVTTPNTTTTFPDGGFITQTKSGDPRLGGAAPYIKNTLYRTGIRNDSDSKQISLDRYDHSNIFNFKQREIITRASTSQPISYTFDSALQEWHLVSSAGRSSQGKIDSQERPVFIQTGNLEPVEISYDNFGHVSQIKQGSRVSVLSYDANGFLSSVTDPLQRQHRFTKDLVGRTTRQTSPSGDSVDFRYDKNSNLTALLPSGKDWHQFAYSLVDLFSVYQAPVVGSENSTRSYVFNLSRDLQKMTRADGQEVLYEYNPSKAQVISVSMGNQKMNFEYADVWWGKITEFFNTENGAHTANRYTGGQLSYWQEYGIQSNNPSLESSVSVYRDVHGRISSLAHSYFWSNLNRLTIPLVYDPDDLIISAGDLQIARSSDNGLVSGTQLGGVSDAFSYNNFGEISGYQSPVFTYSVQRDALGRIIQKTETTAAGSASYNYHFDANDRLFRVDKNGTMISQYTFDGNGNRLSVTANGESSTAVFDHQDRIQQQGATEYSFNAEGELQQKTQGSNITKYQYGLYGQLRKVELATGHVISYDINGMGLRIGKRVDGVLQKFYQWQSSTQIIAELTPTGSEVSRFVYALQGHSPEYMIKNGVSYRFIKDHLGSIRFVVSASDGAIVQKMDYDEWGRVLVDTNPGFQPFGFAGGMYDGDTGLVRFGARDYDAETGRWTSKDPILFNGGDTNLYGYTFSDPINFIDPSGLSSITYSRGASTITVRDRNGNTVGTYPAGNNTARSSNGPWPNGTYSYLYRVPHPESAPNGPYGSNGNFVFDVPGRTGMGVHSGRQGPNSNTMGCIRTTDDATNTINNLNDTDPLTSIIVGD